MNCTDCKDTFTDILDEDAPRDMTTAFKAHLASCPSCASDFSGFKKTVQTLHEIPQRQVPADFIIGINEKLDTSTFAKLKNWFSFMGQHKLTASATMATLIVGVISATVLQTPEINQTQVSKTGTTYAQTITIQQELKGSDRNYYPGVPYLTEGKKSPSTVNKTTPVVQFASATPRTTASFYNTQPSRGSPQGYNTTYASINTASNPKPDFHIIIHPASSSQQQIITRKISANSQWKTFLHQSTLFVTLTDQQLPEFQKLFPPAAPPHKRLDLTPLANKTDQHLFTIAISFK